MIYYYKMVLLDSDVSLGVVTSNDFRKYIRGRMFIAESPKVANCFIYENNYYRALWMTEVDGVTDNYSTVNLYSISEEEYNEYLKNRLKK